MAPAIMRMATIPSTRMVMRAGVIFQGEVGGSIVMAHDLAIVLDRLNPPK